MREKAFTLSEVLITVVIIGIIAAITVPSIISNTRKHEYKSALKKAISAMNNALDRSFALDGFSATDFNTAEELVEKIFKRQTNYLEQQVTFPSDDCTGSTFATTDGIIFCVQNFSSAGVHQQDSECNLKSTIPCTESDAANLWIDVNGQRKPNRATEDSSRPFDIYQAQIYSRKVLPYGRPTIEFMYDSKYKDVTPEETTQPSTTPELPTEPPTEPPTQPTTEPPTQPTTDITDINPEDVPDDPMDLYDPNRWPSLLDFLRWLWKLLGRIFWP